MYEKCRVNFLVIKKKSTYVLIGTCLLLIFSRVIYPGSTNWVSLFLKLQMHVILLIGFYNLLCGLFSKHDDAFKWVIQSKTDNLNKAHLIHCYRVRYTFNLLKIIPIIILSWIVLQLSYINPDATQDVIRTSIYLFICQVFAFAITDICAALLDYASTIAPWKEYGSYYKQWSRK